jgi:cold shock CspA family protein
VVSKYRGINSNNKIWERIMIKLMVFIDGTWLYSNLRHLARESHTNGFYIDYGVLPKALKRYLEEREGMPTLDLVRTTLFGSYPVNYDAIDEDRAQRRKDFFSLLREDYHYEVETFPIDYQRRRILHDDRPDDDSFTPKEKCVDIALASSVMHHAALDSFDVAAVVVGDKDYYPLLQKVRNLGKRVAIVSIRQSCARVYADPADEKGLKDFHVIWLNDMVDQIAWKPTEQQVECKSPLHEGEREVITTIRLREGQPFFCDECRVKFAEQKAEQMRQYTSAGLDNGYLGHDQYEDDMYDDDDEYAEYEGHHQGDDWGNREYSDENGRTHEGVIENMIPDRGFGFIRRNDGASYFFHVTHLANAEWATIRPGLRAQFTVTKSPVGAKAGSAGRVTIVGED